MSLFNVDWRKIFNISLPPIEREPQNLDLGESLLTTLKTESDAIDTLFTDSKAEVTNASITMVLRQLLREEFSDVTIEVETARTASRPVYLSRESENEPIYLSTLGENSPLYLSRESEPFASASIIVRVPAVIFAAQFNQVDAFVKNKKVAGKTYIIESL